MSYHEITALFYAEAAETPQIDPCCNSTIPLEFPDLRIPEIIYQMNYSCKTTIWHINYGGFC